MNWGCPPGRFYGITVKNQRGRLTPQLKKRRYSPWLMYIGMDVHCKKAFYVACDEQGKVISQGKIATSVEAFYDMLDRLKALGYI